MKTFLIRGVPLAMQQDGWWLNPPTHGDTSPPTRDRPLPDAGRIGLLVLLITLGDVLVWQVVPGLSLAVFGATLVLAALWIAGARLARQRQALVLGGAVLALLPLVELVQPLSVLIAAVGISALLVVVAGVHTGQLPRGLMRLWPSGVSQGWSDMTRMIQGQAKGGRVLRWRQLVQGWLMPVMLGLVFVVLLLQANPIAARWAQNLSHVEVEVPDTARMMFWAILLPLVWTALSLHRMCARLTAPPRRRKFGPYQPGLINPASVTRALVLFNGVFALQTGMDIVYLYGGVGLPEGITYAQYAHRGAYPLVATALLAGGFALLTRRWTHADAMLRGLLMLWVVQNVALVISSMVRLDLYVGIYGLTHLRMAAAIWMALVAAGLALILFQTLRGLDNRWLLLRLGGLATVVLYGCTWLSFDAKIARYNLTHDVESDRRYLCNLGDAAKPVIAAHDAQQGWPTCRPRHYLIMAPSDWREWGFRNARARNSLRRIQAEAHP